MKRKFYLIDRENNNERRRVTMKEILQYYNRDAPAGLVYTRNSIDLERYRLEMDEIGYTFVIEHKEEK